jgi:hypothetical protein
MRGLAATLKELKEEINSIANAYINEHNEAWARGNSELAKMAQEAADRGRGARPSRRTAKTPRTVADKSGRAR